MPTRVTTALCGLALLLIAGVHADPARAEDRTLTFKQMHTHETLTVTFKRNGRYDRAALKKINYFLRDWRRNETTEMDPRLIDLIWEVRRKLRTNAAVHVLSGYRSPVTNAALRSRSSGVAKFSQHMLGKALDFYLPGVSLAAIREAGLKAHVGGVGYYPRSGSPFIHLDTGSVRHWPRMSRQQLARVFPDGKTLHLPSDGRPLDGYQVALAEAQRRKSGGSSGGGRSLLASLGLGGGGQRADANDPSRPVAPGGGKNFFAALFNGGEDGDEEEATNPAPAPVAVAAVAAPPRLPAADAPLPPRRPEIAVAAADIQPSDDAVAKLIAAQDVPLPAPKPTLVAAVDAARTAEPALAEADIPMPPAADAPDPVVVAGLVPPARPLIPSASAAPAADEAIVPHIVTALAPTGDARNAALPFDKTFTGGSLETSVRLVPMDLRVTVVDSVAICPTVWRTGGGIAMRHPDQSELGSLIAGDGRLVDNRFHPRAPLDYANRFSGEPIGHVDVRTLKLASFLPGN